MLAIQYKTVVITSPVVEQHCLVYKISIPKCLYFITYFNRRLGTWLCCNVINILMIAHYAYLEVVGSCAKRAQLTQN